jgi:CDP-diacylglycerol--glycerol-3-phosphate 3-phosphatidyltransferase
MASIYDLKPAFQTMLRPVCGRLAAGGITANQVTLGALALSLCMGAALTLSGGARWALWLVPVVLFLRMALNAIDGMLAREHGQASRLGALLNELADLASDAALYLPFALVAGVSPGWLVAVVVLSLIAEAAGILGPAVGSARRYDGPFGKSDRAVAFGLIAVFLASGLLSVDWINWALSMMAALAVLTMVNRVRAALREDGE